MLLGVDSHIELTRVLCVPFRICFGFVGFVKLLKVLNWE